MPEAAARLDLTGLSKSFGAVRAISEVDLRIAPGEIHGLCGHNGAGKSTLIKVLAGLVRPDHGEIRMDGSVVEFHDPRSAQRAGIAWVDQELSLAPSLSVAENIALGSVDAGLLRRPRKIRREARELLDRVGLEDQDPAEQVGALGLGTRQLVEIARAIGRRAGVLILDEPTATLTEVEIEHVFRAVRRIAAEGCAVIFVSHRLDEVLSLCDAVTVLRDGSVVDARPVSELSPARLVELMLGEQLEPSRRHGRSGEGATVLRVDRLTVGSRLIDFSHDFQAGCVYGLAGQLGAGASDVLRALAGLAPAASGSVELDGRGMALRHPIQINRRGVGFITNDRKQEGLFLTRSVTENLTAAQLSRLAYGGHLSLAKERHRAKELAAAAGVATERLDEEVGVLSGGNQQKVLVGRYLRSPQTRVLLVDEPTRGVDIAGRAAIHDLLRDAASEGRTVIFASSDLDELLELAMTVITMRNGRVVAVYEDGVSRQAMLADLTHESQVVA